MYITYDKNTMYATGCSSSLPICDYIEIESVDEKFYGRYHCFKVDIENNELIYDEDKYEEYLEMKNSFLTPIQELAQENSQFQIDMIKLKMCLNFPVTLNEDTYWYEKLSKKHASQKQINELIELGILSKR